MSNLFDPTLTKTFKEDRQLLKETQVPIVTVSGTYREDLKRWHGYEEDPTEHDVVLSRAHYSMALGIAAQAWGDKLDSDKAWIVDPTNYVSKDDWSSVSFTEFVGKTLARHSLLKLLKDLVDKFARNKLPILDSITPPLLYLTEKLDKPILSFHIAAGNILAKQGKTILEVVTDPHVRYDYLENAELPNMHFCVFNPETKVEFLEQAKTMGKDVDPDRITVTGPPIDPRILAARENKLPWRSGKLKLCITTGGLGTNKQEIKQLLEQLLPELRKRKPQYQLLVYAGTHQDIYEMVLDMAYEARVAIGDLKDTSHKLRVIYNPQIIDANETLIKYGFPWADGFISKPSGDMTYDAAAAGSFILTLQEWGEWEERIREIFTQKSIARPAIVDKIVPQLEFLMDTQGKSQSWIERAMNQTHQLDDRFYQGAENILKTYKKLAKKK